MRHMNALDNLVRDIRLGVRTLIRNPGFTLATLGALISALTIRQPSPAQRPAAADPVAASERVG